MNTFRGLHYLLKGGKGGRGGNRMESREMERKVEGNEKEKCE